MRWIPSSPLCSSRVSNFGIFLDFDLFQRPLLDDWIVRMGVALSGVGEILSNLPDDHEIQLHILLRSHVTSSKCLMCHLQLKETSKKREDDKSPE